MNNFWKKLNPPIVSVAPMDGITDYAFRQICKQQGADVLYTEFVSADGIYHALKNMKPTMAFDKSQSPVICQLFGKDPKYFKHAAGIVEEMGFDGVDINFGCPSKKVVKHGSGVKLMTNLNLVHEIVDATLEGVKNIPVSIKIRSGINLKPEDQENNAVGVDKVVASDMIEKIKDLPFTAIMIHGRTYEQGFNGKLDIDQIKKVKKIAKDRIVLVNGGITTPENAKEILDQTKVDGIGIGRGIFGQPWLLQQTKDYLLNGSYKHPTWDEIKKIMIDHATLIFGQKGNHGMLEIRKHLSWYIKGFPNARKFRAELVRVESIEDVKQILNSIK